MRLSQREKDIYQLFEAKWFQKVGTNYRWNPKIIVNVFGENIKNIIARKSGVADEYGPDFAIVKQSQVSVENGIQIVDMLEETRFSLWRILQDEEKPPFICVRKEWKAIRIPDFRKSSHGYWEVTGRLLVR